MRGPKPEPFSLSDAEKDELDLLVRRYSTPQQLALRGRMILMTNEGKSDDSLGLKPGASQARA
jgi:hypothetical protein